MFVKLYFTLQYSESAGDCIDAGGPPCGMITNIDAMVLMTNWTYSNPTGWNDADMLQVPSYCLMLCQVLSSGHEYSA